MHERTPVLGRRAPFALVALYRGTPSLSYTRNCRTYGTVSSVTCRQSTATAVVYERERLLGTPSLRIISTYMVLSIYGIIHILDTIS